MQIFHIRHLDHKQHIGPIARLGSFRQSPQVLGTPLCGRIRESADPVVLQRHALHLQKTGLSRQGKGKIEPGIPVEGLGLQFRHFPQSPGQEPFLRCGVGGLGIHVDEPVSLSDGNQVVFGFPGRIAAFLAPDLGPGEQQFPAAAGVFHVDDLRFPADLHMGDEPVGPGQEDPRRHIVVVQTDPTFLPQVYYKIRRITIFLPFTLATDAVFRHNRSSQFGKEPPSMKRSEINKALKELEAMCEQYRCYLPPFCHFTPEDWESKGHEYDEVRDCCLGWDITDYGMGDFDKMGFSLITIRNGSQTMPDKYPKVYAEKLLYLKEGQYSPNHFHWYKTEDIINRGGGNVLIRVYNSNPAESIDYESDVTVHTDGRTYTVPAGTQIRLTPGESIFIQQYLYHDFEVEPGTGPVLLGEVSQCNDDANDNRFNPPMGRFPAIEEDEAPYRLLCTEYPPAK